MLGLNFAVQSSDVHPQRGSKIKAPLSTVIILPICHDNWETVRDRIQVSFI